MSKKCPKCFVISHDSASRCDCGYEFSSGQVKPSFAGISKSPTKILTSTVIGMLAFFAGKAAFQGFRSENGFSVGTKRESTVNWGETNDKFAKMLPMMVDKDTELWSVIGVEKALMYNYRLVNQNGKDLQPGQIRKALYTQIRNSACSTPDTRDGFLRKGICMRYQYYDMNKVFIERIDIFEKDCI